MLRLRWRRILRSALSGVLLLASADLPAQPGKTGSAIGAEGIRVILTQHAQWTVYWSSLGAAPRPPASAGSGTIEFTRRGDRLMGHLSIPVLGQDCEFEVVVRDDGFTYPGCARFDKV